MPLNSLPPSELTRQAVVRRRIMPTLGIEQWSDAAKVALVSGLTVPFALSWLVRTLQIQQDATLSTYVSRGFLPVLVPFLVLQLVGHAALTAIGLALRRRTPRARPWLVHVEAQLWCGCLAFSLYAVGTFTHPFAVMLLVLPVVGYLLFDARPVHFGMATLSIGVTIGAVLPLLGVAPYAPFLDHAPFADGHLQPTWVLSAGVPTLFAALVGAVLQARLVRGLRERQAELEWLSSTDALTGLWNRAAFYARLDEEIGRTRRHRMPLTLLMIDVDHFKKVNDTHGHAVGDQVLRDLAETMRTELRPGDVMARHGGEELAVLLPQTATAAAERVAERLLVVARSVAVGSGDERTTVSIGVAELTQFENADALVARADAALYDAKHAGRDRHTTALAPDPQADAAYATIAHRGPHVGRTREEEEVTPR